MTDSHRKVLRKDPQRWLVTGAAGFIGSHLLQFLLEHDQRVVVLDDFSSGKRSNLEAVEAAVGPEAWARFTLVEGDVRDGDLVDRLVADVDLVSHQAARGSVPGSLDDPDTYHAVNVDGTINILHAARRHGTRGVVFASSAAVYGDDPTQPKVEDAIGKPLSPYALGKWIAEEYAELYARVYELPVVGLRYFNVVGARQDPAGAYAAVVPKWLERLVAGKATVIYGDGETSRDFCPVANIVQANALAALQAATLRGRVFNIALGQRTSLLELEQILREGMAARGAPCGDLRPVHEEFRAGDIRHSHASIDRARAELGYQPEQDLATGLGATMDSVVAQATGATGSGSVEPTPRRASAG